ncbi:GH25 family lysozyme [Roseibium aestuarii]|uniref:GH25 family lysozyme n=1 Tax=Roseibium aestuarii TaxID=2600299 RepID=A0ABW4JZG9_9HYPH|nr:GH25 family lysozyme [Roseibium aestuarii]
MGLFRTFFQKLFKALFYGIVALTLVFCGAVVFFMTWEPDRGTYPHRGLHLSEANGAIDFSMLARDDVSFVYLRVSQGDDRADPAFAANWEAASHAGLPVGGAHVLSPCVPGADQAGFFLSRLPAGQDMLAPVLELDGGATPDCPAQDPADFRRTITAFVQTVEQGTGGQVILRASEEVYRSVLRGAGLNRPLWARSLWRSPSYVRDWRIWSYQSRGAVRGILGDADLNVLAAGLTPEDLRLPTPSN